MAFRHLAVAGALIGFLLVGGLAYAAPGPYNLTIQVGPDDLADCGPVPAAPTCQAAHHGRTWFFYDDVKDKIDNTQGSFVICQYGPCPYYDGTGENPPLGTGSAQISTVLNRRPNLATYQFGGIKLSAITTLRFSTYNPSAGNKSDPTRSGYLHFNVDFGPGVCPPVTCATAGGYQRRLVFVPRSNGVVVQNHWQEWDAIDGVGTPGSKAASWTYSGPTWPAGAAACIAPGGTPKTWSQILTCYPNARILSGDSFLGIRVGEPYADGYTENIDAFKFGTALGTVTYDFDPGQQDQHGHHDDDGDDDQGGHDD